MMVRRPPISLTAEDRATVARWRRFMLSAVAVLLLAFVAAEGLSRSRMPVTSAVAQDLRR
jgi:hypothetical protein